MKLLKFVVLGLIVAACSGKGGDDEEMIPLAKRILYSVKVDDNSYPPFQYLEFEKRNDLAALIFKLVESGKLKLYSDEEGTIELSPEEFRRSITRYFGHNMTNEEGEMIGYTDDSLMITPRDITEYGFLEEWQYHPETFQFVKVVKAFAPMYPDFSIDTLGAKHYREEKVLIGWIFPGR